MDGVVVDWSFRVSEIVQSLTGKPILETLEYLSDDSHRVEDFGIDEREIHKVMEEGGYHWWYYLPEINERFPNCPTAKSLYELCSSIAPTYFLTAIPAQMGRGAESSAAGKLGWLKNRLGNTFSNVFICRRDAKKLLAAPGRVLIDDFSRNTKEFIESGGMAIHFKAREQSLDRINTLLTGARW
jgi:hypothetical protein